jgi:hypothetical protein
MSLDKHQLARLHAVLGPFMLRRVKADVVAEMVPKTEVCGWWWCVFVERCLVVKASVYLWRDIALCWGRMHALAPCVLPECVSKAFTLPFLCHLTHSLAPLLSFSASSTHCLC